MEIAKGTILGAPRTKKNSSRIIFTRKHGKGRMRGKRVPILLPSEVYVAWLEQALPQIKVGPTPIDFPVNCRAIFYRKIAIGDADNYYHALADCLEKAGVVKNDKWIVSWDGSRIRKDNVRPRIEWVLEKSEEPVYPVEMEHLKAAEEAESEHVVIEAEPMRAPKIRRRIPG